VIIIKMMLHKFHKLSYNVLHIKLKKIYLNIIHLLVNTRNQIINILINKLLYVIIYNTISHIISKANTYYCFYTNISISRNFQKLTNNICVTLLL